MTHPTVWPTIEPEVFAILQNLSHGKGTHLGNPFLTAYQLAIELVKRNPGVLTLLGSALTGGIGAGPGGLAHYLASQLSYLIAHHPGYPVEGGVLSSLHIMKVKFDDNGTPLLPSSLELTLFRWR